MQKKMQLEHQQIMDVDLHVQEFVQEDALVLQMDLMAQLRVGQLISTMDQKLDVAIALELVQANVALAIIDVQELAQQIAQELVEDLALLTLAELHVELDVMENVLVDVYMRVKYHALSHVLEFVLILVDLVVIVVVKKGVLLTAVENVKGLAEILVVDVAVLAEAPVEELAKAVEELVQMDVVVNAKMVVKESVLLVATDVLENVMVQPKVAVMV